MVVAPLATSLAARVEQGISQAARVEQAHLERLAETRPCPRLLLEAAEQAAEFRRAVRRLLVVSAGARWAITLQEDWPGRRVAVRVDRHRPLPFRSLGEAAGAGAATSAQVARVAQAQRSEQAARAVEPR